MVTHTHYLFFEAKFTDDQDALRLSLSLQDTDDFDVEPYFKHVDPETHDINDWYLIERATGKITEPPKVEG